jgi:aspartyl-tRNA(Asn)/glutamyl-tRNA(Gln) amidotransferase subunit C
MASAACSRARPTARESVASAARKVGGYPSAVATLSRRDVEHVAHLARLGLSEEELARLEGELNHILDQYAVLAQLDTEHIPPTAQTIEVDNILRDDVVRPGLSAEEVLGIAPARRGAHIIVPPILPGEEA